MAVRTIYIFIISLSILISACTTKTVSPQESIAKAINYLEKTQQSDGSWKSYKSPLPDFSQKIPQPAVYPTMLIMRSLNTAQLSTAMTKKGFTFIQSTVFDNGLWSISGKQHFFTYQFDKYPCFVEPDSDATALGWTLLNQKMPQEKLVSILPIFKQFQTESGLFKSYFTHLMFKEKACPADYGNTPSIGSNLNILTFFALEKKETKSLLDALSRATARKNFEKEAIYYKNLPYLAYLAHFPTRYGVDTKPLVRQILSHYDTTKTGEENTVQLSAYLIAIHFLGSSCKEIIPLATLLIKRQQPDGSFLPAPIYEARGGKKRTETVYYGSAAETTAIAIEALTVVKQCQK